MKKIELMTAINKIFDDNTSYNIPAHAANQADAITALSVDLYTDANRFIYELLQNADDSSYKVDGVKVWIKVFNDELVVAHSGKVFDVQDIRGICNINNGTKKSDLQKTGYKGIGFKSVFGQSNNVVIYTDGEFFRFDSSYNFEWIWDGSQKEWENENNRTFQYPWQIIPIYTESTKVVEKIRNYISEIDATVATILKIKHIKETMDAIQDLSQNINMFLFLKNITEINFEDRVITIDRSNTNRIILNKGRISQKDWLIKNVNLNVSEELRNTLLEERHIPPKLLEANNIEMIFAAQIDKNGIVILDKKDRVLYSYLPTAVTQYAVPVLVNTSFLISANRESIHKDSKWNQWLFECISYEIFKWIAELVISEISFEAYKLIPEETLYSDGLANSYNLGIKKAKEDIAFVLSRKNTMIKISEALIDFTYLSEKNFIGEEPIKNFIAKQNSNAKTKCYVKKCVFWIKLKNLGVSSFEWKDIKSFLNSTYFKDIHSIQNNIELIKFMKACCKSEKIKDVSEEYVCDLPFIWDHKNHINYPKRVCFPAANDKNWDNIDNELSFVHKDILDWLLHDLETKNWLESLGVKEKTDITYITQNIIPHASDYINKDNAISEIQKLFLLYRKGDLKENLIQKLSEIKLITTKNTLLQASKCYLSDFYSPRLKIEKILKEDIFISEKYCYNIYEKDDWKQFFKILGASQGTNTLIYEGKSSRSSCMDSEINYKYFDEIASKTPIYYTGFSINSIGNITSINYIHFIENNYKLSLEFWKDYIENFTPEKISISARGYWGYSGMDGQVSGKTVENYIPWFIRNIKCVPTLTGKVHISSEVFLNTEEIEDIAGKYLPVFKGVQLSQDWKAFFNFKAQLELKDYLCILTEISLDIQDDGNIKKENYERIQLIYSILLDNCSNWSSDNIGLTMSWSNTNCLLNSKDSFTNCKDLNYFVDGNESVFQEQYKFIKLNAKNKNHPNLKKMLTYFHVKLLSQNQFNLVCDNKVICNSLKTKLISIVPYLKIWIDHNKIDDNIEQKLLHINDKINDLEIYQSDELKITYNEMNFIKFVNLHFDENKLYITSPWNSNSVLLRLAEVLCTYFGIEGHTSKLDFLLRADVDEIQQYFIQESIEFPAEWTVTNQQTHEKNIQPDSNDYYESSEPDFDKKNYIENLIPRAVENVINHLSNLSEYDCSDANVIGEKSVIGGIKKNGNEIAVVARPSDNEKIRLFYESEFDILEYADAELWYEDGRTPPRQFTFGQLLKMQGTNKIPLKKVKFKDIQASNPKSEILEFNAVPYSPEKTAQIIASFANTEGGTLIFGIKERSKVENEVVGLSSDFRVDEIVRKAVSLLSPTPTVNYSWVTKGKQCMFVIEIDKSNSDILINNQKFVRTNDKTNLYVKNNGHERQLNSYVPQNTIAVIIAIENYLPRNGISTVKYAKNDAIIFKNMLIEVMGIQDENIYLILNEEAVKNTLEYDLKRLFSSLTERDRLIFYYAGHGFHNGVSNCLSTYDMHPSNIVATSIELDQMLLNPLKSSKCRNALIFIDACAQSFKNEFSRNNVSNLNEDSLNIFTKDHPYYAIFLSCQTGESSYSSHEFENGIWTHYLIDAIYNTPEPVLYNNRYLTDVRLRDFLTNNVSDYVKKELDKVQSPKAIIDSSYENVILEVTYDEKQNDGM